MPIGQPRCRGRAVVGLKRGGGRSSVDALWVGVDAGARQAAEEERRVVAVDQTVLSEVRFDAVRPQGGGLAQARLELAEVGLVDVAVLIEVRGNRGYVHVHGQINRVGGAGDDERG